jgi:cyclase
VTPASRSVRASTWAQLRLEEDTGRHSNEDSGAVLKCRASSNRWSEPMRRTVVLGALVLVGAISVAAFQQPQQPSVDAITVEKVKDNLWVLRGGGGNTALFVTGAGAVVVDTKSPGWGKPLLEKIKTITDKPITMIINTHTHYDHVSGNPDFPTTVDIVVHENTKPNMAAMRDVYGRGPVENVFKASGGQGLPKKTFKDKMTIGKGPDQIDLYYFGRAHTDGDAYVVFPALRVMHVGDTFPNKGLPIMDKNNGGSGVEYAATLTKASGVQNVDTLINGHTPANTTPAELKEYAEFIREFVTAVQAAKKSGKTIDEVAASWKVPANYAGYPAVDPARLKSNVEVIYGETK